MSEKDPLEKIVFFDGHCGMCHKFVRFVLSKEPSNFHFAPLGGDTFNQTLASEQHASLPDSIVLYYPDGTLHVKSEAVIRILRELGTIWQLVADIAALFPTKFSNWVYDFIAKIRANLFSRPNQTCPLVPKHLRGYFLP